MAKSKTSTYVLTLKLNTEEFQENTSEQIAQLAKSFSAEDKVTAGDTEIYIGTSIKGPQSVIFTKNKLLILIKSTSKIPNEKWANYVLNLK